MTQGKDNQAAAEQSVELNSTRSNTTVPVPKVRRKNLETWHLEAFPDAHLSLQRARVSRRTDGRTVGGQ